MSLLGNLLWILLGGLIGALLWTVAGILCCLTLVGIPSGAQCFKIAGLTLAPFGREVRLGSFGAGGLIGNILWLLFLGWELCLAHLAMALVCAVTIVGIPFAIQHLKLARLSLVPFGSVVL